MSPLQYGTLRYISREEPLIRMARLIRQTTLSSLFYQEWVKVITRNDEKRIVATRDGEEALEQYSRATYSRRSHEADITPTVQQYIRYRIITMPHRKIA